MIKEIRFFPTLLLVAVILAACSPAPPATQASTPPPVVELPSAIPVEATEVEATQPPVATEPPLAVATSRGPDLHATDPTTVSLAAGQYQFVEFFRFT